MSAGELIGPSGAESVPPKIQVFSGIPFRIPASLSLDQSKESDDEITEIGVVDLDLTGLGRGRLRVLRIIDDGEWYGNIKTPLGPIETHQIRTDNTVEQDTSTSPLTTEIILYDLTKTQGESIVCGLIAGGTRYRMEADRLSWTRTEEGKYEVNFSQHFEVATGKESLVWYPQDPGAKDLKEGLEYTITY